MNDNTLVAVTPTMREFNRFPFRYIQTTLFNIDGSTSALNLTLPPLAAHDTNGLQYANMHEVYDNLAHYLEEMACMLTCWFVGVMAYESVLIAVDAAGNERGVTRYERVEIPVNKIYMVQHDCIGDWCSLKQATIIQRAKQMKATGAPQILIDRMLKANGL